MTSNKKVRRRKDAERLRPKVYIDNVEAPLWKHGIYNLKKKRRNKKYRCQFCREVLFYFRKSITLEWGAITNRSLTGLVNQILYLGNHV